MNRLRVDGGHPEIEEHDCCCCCCWAEKQHRRSHACKRQTFKTLAGTKTGAESLLYRKLRTKDIVSRRQRWRWQPDSYRPQSRGRVMFLLLPAIAIVVMTTMTTTLHLPRVHSMSLNTNGRRAPPPQSSTTSLFLAASSPTSRGSGRSKRDNYNNKHNNNKHNQNASPSPTNGESRWQRAVRIEQRTQFALEDLQQIINLKTNKMKLSSTMAGDGNDTESVDGDQQLSPSGKNTIIIRRRKSGILSSVPSSTSSSSTTAAATPATPATTTASSSPNAIAFPDIRECNSALAAFGDGGDLLRALRLYFKMRKATQIALTIVSSSSASDGSDSGTPPLVPTPTLVTYSTIMSRAVSLGKPQVALRLWKIMRDQTDFFSYASYNSKTSGSTPPIKASELQNLIVPDVKSANILMNTYAKLGDIDAAEDLMKQMQSRPVLPQQMNQKHSKSPKSAMSLHAVVFGGGIDVPHLMPNLVTYNTLLDACQKTGEIDRALHWKAIMERESRAKGRNKAKITYRNGRTISIRLKPDARTYTSLIGTVAKASSRSSGSYGNHDPSLAFQLLEEMKTKHCIAPNPLTYSALIDVCGRCRRSDLALKALRLMLRDEEMIKRIKANSNNHATSSASAPSNASTSGEQQTVGAWTAAINACGKTGRIDTALKLFFVSMPRFRVKPNVITCSCLLDSLLKNGKTAESLEVFRYMKNHNLSPSKYMYTSLMTYASRLAGLEQNQKHHSDLQFSSVNAKDDDIEFEDDGATNRPWPSLLDSQDVNSSSGSTNSNNESPNHAESTIKDGRNEDQTRAVDLYSELMSTLIATTGRKTPKRGAAVVSTNSTTAPYTMEEGPFVTSNELYQVTMIFREMKASGVVPDLGSYNTLLRSCASSGDIDRAEEILREILDPANDLVPNDRTWRAVLRTAGKAKRSDVVLQTWQAAVADMGGGHNSNTDREKEADAAASKTDVTSPPSSTKSKKQTQRKSNNLSLQTFRTLLMALLICAWDLRESDRHTSVELYKIIIKCYNALRSSSASSSSQSNIEQLQQQKGLYMGMHLVDSRAAMDNPQVLASILQAIVNLESLLERDDAWKGKLRQLGISIAGERCLLGSSGNGERSSSLSYFDKKALNTAESWYAEETKPS